MKKASIIFEMGQMLRFVTNHFCFRFIAHGMPETFFFLALEIFVYIFSKFLGMSEMFKASLRNLFVAVNP